MKPVLVKRHPMGFWHMNIFAQAHEEAYLGMPIESRTRPDRHIPKGSSPIHRIALYRPEWLHQKN